MLTLSLLSSVIQNEHITHEIYEYCGLLTQRKDRIAYKNKENHDSLHTFQTNFIKVPFFLLLLLVIPTHILT